VSVDELNAPAPVSPPAAVASPPPVVEPGGWRAHRVEPGPFNTLVMMCNLGAALVYALWLGRGLPPEVASHFGVAGDANDTMSRDGFVVAMLATMVGLPLILWTGLGWAMPWRLINIPHADYWFAEPRRPATQRYVYRHFTWFCVGLTAFMGYIFWLVAAANAGAPAHPVLDSNLSTPGLAIFVAAVTAWAVTLSVRFRRLDA
jgi:hypothetical protein